MEVGESKSTTVKEEDTSSLSGRPEGQSDPGGSFGLWKQEDDHNMGDAAASVTLPALGDPHSEDTKPVLPSPAKEATPNSLHPQIPDLAPPPQPPAQVDPDLFLSFQTEEDKKVKMEQEESSTNDGPRRSGRVQPARNGLGRSQGSARKLESPDEAAGNGDRKPATRAKKEEDDMDEDIASGRSDSEDEKPEASMRKPGQPVSIAHLPVATEEAMATYEELEFSWYQNKSLGRTRQQEDAMVCDCRYDPETDDIDAACGEHSGCINRLTQVECVASECRCGPHCQNQSFQKREFGPVEIVQTEKKGFGMRATADIARDTFIYEYVGDVIGEKKFTQRMQEYYDEGVIHFYFMMLQKDEFIDATKRGGKGRFFNHSCAPNCYVAKWVVGRKLRMGIFAKRFIEANEELTFNYNVDRYGHEAQECFCGEPNCVGYIGGKTQTDIGGMDDLFLDALGITDEVEAMQLKGSKKKKGRKLDEDFNPTMTQIAIDDVPKVSSAIRQATGNKRIISKLLARILLTEDTVVQRQIMRLHGFSMMSTVLHESGDDNEIVIAVLGVLAKWPLITKNKLQSTNMESVVQGLAENEKEPTISEPAKQLLELWQGLSIGYRIPKAIRETIVESDEVKRQREAAVAEFEKSRRQQALEDEKEEEERRLERERWRVARLIQTRLMQAKPITPRIEPAKLPPPNWQFYPNGPQAQFAQPPPQYICLLTKLVSKEYPSVHVQQSEALKYKQANTVNVNDVIAKAVAEAEEKAALEARNAAAVIEAAEAAKKAKRDLKEKTSREKKLYRLFSTVVVTTMSKYKKYLDSDQFKRRAKEVCDIMCEKERKSAHYATEKYDSLSPEKEAKIKKYVKDFITKLLTRKGIKVSSSSSSSSSSKHHHSSSSRSHSSHSHSRSSTSSRKDKDRHPSSSHSSRPQPGPSSSAVTPGTPTASASGMMRGHVDEDADDMDMDVDAADDNDNDDLINALVDDATGGPDTPESASRTPQLEPEGTNGVKA